MILLLSALVLSQSPASQAEHALCDVRRLDACRNTNQLAWSPGFRARLRRFSGHRRANYLYRRGSLFEQITAVLGGPPDQPTRLAGNEFLFTASRAHSADEKGAVVLTPEGEILAIGILNYRCGGPPGPEACEDRPSLDMFVRHYGPRTQPWLAAIRTWAEGAAAELGHGTLSGVSVGETAEGPPGRPNESRPVPRH